MANTFTEIIRHALKHSHETLEGTMSGVTDAAAHFQPAGKALPIGAAYAHTIVSEDIMLSWLTKKKPLIEQGWDQKLGVSAPHPAMDANWEKNFSDWSKSVKVELPKLQEYAQAVYKQSDEFLATLNDTDMIENKVDLSMWQMGEMPAASFVLQFLMAHVDSLTGEISAAKGLQDMKGYPF